MVCTLQFTDQGSTKEKLTRPLRKVLAKDPVGPGETQNCQRIHVLRHARHRAKTSQCYMQAEDWRTSLPRLARSGAWLLRCGCQKRVGTSERLWGNPSSSRCRSLPSSMARHATPAACLMDFFCVRVRCVKREGLHALQVFRLSFGPKSFVVVSDAQVARHILFTNAPNYSKGVLSEILDFVMGTGEVTAWCAEVRQAYCVKTGRLIVLLHVAKPPPYPVHSCRFHHQWLPF